MDSIHTSEDFPGFSRIYDIGGGESTRCFRVDLHIEAEELDRLVDGKEKRDTPIPAEWAMGGAVARDVIWTTFVSPILVNQRFIDILRNGDFRGWSASPVAVRGKHGELLPSYFLLGIHGRCGPLDPTRSSIVKRTLPGRVVPMLRGMYFDPSTWDGSDIFMPEGTTFHLIVGRLRDALVRAKVRSINFTRLEEMEIRPESIRR